MITGFHIQKSIERTGSPYKEVHEWLDLCETEPFKNLEKYPFQHRIERHTQEGMEYIKQKWGVKAWLEACHHLSEDGVRL